MKTGDVFAAEAYIGDTVPSEPIVAMRQKYGLRAGTVGIDYNPAFRQTKVLLIDVRKECVFYALLKNSLSRSAYTRQ